MRVPLGELNVLASAKTPAIGARASTCGHAGTSSPIFPQDIVGIPEMKLRRLAMDYSSLASATIHSLELEFNKLGIPKSAIVAYRDSMSLCHS